MSELIHMLLAIAAVLVGVAAVIAAGEVVARRRDPAALLERWRQAEINAGADPEIIAEVVRLVSTHLGRPPTGRERHSTAFVGIQSHRNRQHHQ